MEWPPQSPDLNPIENLWGEVERKLKGRKFKKPDELFDAVNQEWTNLPTELLEKLVGPCRAGARQFSTLTVPQPNIESPYAITEKSGWI